MIAHTPKPYDPRFQFAVVMVRDQDRSLRFYVDQLRFRLVADHEVQYGGRWIVVEPPDRSVQLALVRPPENSNACLRIGSDTGLVLVTRDLETLCEEWSERGVSFPQSPTETPWQARTAIFQDIDGNRFTLVEYGPITQALDAERRAAAEKEQAERLLARELEIATCKRGSCPSMCLRSRVGRDWPVMQNIQPERRVTLRGPLTRASPRGSQARQ